MHVTVDDVNFYDDLECIYAKYNSRASTACELPDYYMGFCWLKHGCYWCVTQLLCNNGKQFSEMNAYIC